MRRIPTPQGPFPYRLHFEFEEMEGHCFEALQVSGFLPAEPQPVRIDAFIEKHFRCDVDYRDLGDDVLGCTEFNADGSVRRVIATTALVKDRHDVVARRRLNATFAHEAGHGLFHGPLFAELAGTTAVTNVEIDQRRILCREADFDEPPGRSRWWEFQANFAIGALLLPAELVRRAVAPFLVNAPTLPAADREAAARLCAALFDVNPAVARIRLGALFPEA